MNLWIAPAKASYVCLEAGLVEPSKHLVDLLAHKESNDKRREFGKLHGPAHDAAKNFRGLKIGQFAPRNLQLFLDEFRWALECQRHKGANVICRNG